MDLLLVDRKQSVCDYMWCWYNRPKAYFMKDRTTEEHASCSLNKEKLILSSLLCYNGFKLLLEKDMRAEVCFAGL
jgi:hypothetical protein